MQNRPDAESCPGGDTVQMHRTAEALRRAGHRLRISLEPRADVSGVDVVHLFNLTRPHETFQQAENARRAGVPYVLSPVYWDLEAAVPWRAYEFPRNWYRAAMPAGMRRWMRRRLAGNMSADPEYLQLEILRDARMVFPNSQAEASHLREKFGDALANAEMVVVRNGIDAAVAAPTTSPCVLDAATAKLVDGAFVCAGAIGPRKNQLNLVRAFRRLPEERLVIIGKASPGSDRYLRAARRAAGPNVAFLPGVPHEQMPPVWHAAKACAQPSWIETPGLSAMEALAMGAAVVAADVPPVREYFGDAVNYCDPASPESIARACRLAAAATRGDGAAFAAKYQWNRVLEDLVEAYGTFRESFRAS